MTDEANILAEDQCVRDPKRLCDCWVRLSNGVDCPLSDEAMTKPDWTKSCDNCGESPIVPATGLCGPCTFGEADTAGGNW